MLVNSSSRDVVKGVRVIVRLPVLAVDLAARRQGVDFRGQMPDIAIAQYDFCKHAIVLELLHQRQRAIQNFACGLATV